MNNLHSCLKSLVFFGLIGWCSQIAQAQQMDNVILGDILVEIADSISGESGSWQFQIEEVPMLCITDASNNRMRIISPISTTENISENELLRCMEANFHSALDVKYAIADEILWVAFIHPLKELASDQVKSAVRQVYNASANYGTTYSSTDLIFPGSDKKINQKPKTNRG